MTKINFITICKSNEDIIAKMVYVNPVYNQYGDRKYHSAMVFDPNRETKQQS